MTKKKLRLKIKNEALLDARIDFFYHFGLAMSEWAILEAALYDWFERASRMKKVMAAAIFYGSRGFSSRAEMLESALEHANSTIIGNDEALFLKADASLRCRRGSGAG